MEFSIIGLDGLFPSLDWHFRWKKLGLGGGWWWVACRFIVSAPVPFLWTLDLGFGTWIWDLDLWLDLGLTIIAPPPPKKHSYILHCYCVCKLQTSKYENYALFHWSKFNHIQTSILFAIIIRLWSVSLPLLLSNLKWSGRRQVAGKRIYYCQAGQEVICGGNLAC